MALDAKVYALDVVRAIDLIAEFTKGLSFETYTNDVLRVSAVERQLSVIGEAVTQFSKLEGTNIELSHARQIIGFRNILIHNYARVSQAVVWTIVQDHLPTLKLECQTFLEQEF
jgi:uncharacterized protein with HEPN domain